MLFTWTFKLERKEYFIVTNLHLKISIKGTGPSVFILLIKCNDLLLKVDVLKTELN